MKEVLKRSPWLLLVLFVTIEGFQHYFLLIAQLSSGQQSVNIMTSLGQLSTSLLEFITLTMLIPMRLMELDNRHQPGRFADFFKKHISDLAAESIKALAYVILWSIAPILIGFILFFSAMHVYHGTTDAISENHIYIALIIFLMPGIYKYISYFFVQYVVVEDLEYAAGRRDALKYSNDLIRPVIIPVFFFAVLLTGFELLRQNVREKFPIQEAPLEALASSLGFFLIAILTHVLLFRFYQLRVKRLNAKDTPKGA